MYGSNDNKPSLTRWEANPRVITGVVVVVLGLVMLVATLTDSQLVGQMIVLLLGMILNRFNVSWLGVHRLTDVGYFPSLMELSISAAIFSFGILAFGLAARYLPLFEEPERTAITSAN